MRMGKITFQRVERGRRQRMALAPRTRQQQQALAGVVPQQRIVGTAMQIAHGVGNP